MIQYIFSALQRDKRKMGVGRAATTTTTTHTKKKRRSLSDKTYLMSECPQGVMHWRLEFALMMMELYKFDDISTATKPVKVLLSCACPSDLCAHMCLYMLPEKGFFLLCDGFFSLALLSQIRVGGGSPFFPGTYSLSQKKKEILDCILTMESLKKCNKRLEKYGVAQMLTQKVH